MISAPIRTSSRPLLHSPPPRKWQLRRQVVTPGGVEVGDGRYSSGGSPFWLKGPSATLFAPWKLFCLSFWTMRGLFSASILGLGLLFGWTGAWLILRNRIEHQKEIL